MRHNASLLKDLRDAVRNAARNLEGLKLVNPGREPDVGRIVNELRSFIPDPNEETETSPKQQ